jgi:hypothetical protein
MKRLYGLLPGQLGTKVRACAVPPLFPTPQRSGCAGGMQALHTCDARCAVNGRVREGSSGAGAAGCRAATASRVRPRLRSTCRCCCCCCCATQHAVRRGELSIECAAHAAGTPSQGQPPSLFARTSHVACAAVAARTRCVAAGGRHRTLCRCARIRCGQTHTGPLAQGGRSEWRVRVDAICCVRDSAGPRARAAPAGSHTREGMRAQRMRATLRALSAMRTAHRTAGPPAAKTPRVTVPPA